MGTSKRERQEAAQFDAAKRVGKRGLTLSMAMMRADALFQAFEHAMAELAANPESEEARRDAAVAGTKRLENTAFTKADALISVQLGVLYSVVEKWQEWEFADPTVDSLLLDTDHLKLLRDHRHAVFHSSSYDDKAIRAFAARTAILPWVAQLAAALRSYLRRWHASPADHVEAHLARVGW